MLLQRRVSSCLLIEQHAHAWVSGEMASLWCGASGDVRLSHALLQAIALHDLPWQESDRELRWDARTQLPFDFLGYPLDERLSLYSRGLATLAMLHPYVGLLVSRHYAAFKGLRGQTGFQKQEATRQEALLKRLSWMALDDNRLAVDLQYLQLFDLLSLYLCLAAPGVDASSRPPWLWPQDTFLAPDGVSYSLSWKAPGTLGIEPFPFDDDVHVCVPYAEVEGVSFTSQGSWQAAWDQRSEDVLRVSFVPASQEHDADTCLSTV